MALVPTCTNTVVYGTGIAAVWFGFSAPWSIVILRNCMFQALFSNESYIRAYGCQGVSRLIISIDTVRLRPNINGICDVGCHGLLRLGRLCFIFHSTVYDPTG